MPVGTGADHDRPPSSEWTLNIVRRRFSRRSISSRPDGCASAAGSSNRQEESSAALDGVVEELLAVILMAAEHRRTRITFEVALHDALARKTAGESLVLLKNSEVIVWH